MTWFNPKSKKQPQEIEARHIQFVGEQDGSAEQLLKHRLCQLFKKDRRVLAAYLVRVSLNRRMGVALCLKTASGEDQGLIEEVYAIFRSIFRPDVYLDIVFTNPTQESELVQVCKAFFPARDDDE
jgi:hypothetical protein